MFDEMNAAGAPLTKGRSVLSFHSLECAMRDNFSVGSRSFAPFREETLGQYPRHFPTPECETQDE